MVGRRIRRLLRLLLVLVLAVVMLLLLWGLHVHPGALLSCRCLVAFVAARVGPILFSQPVPLARQEVERVVLVVVLLLYTWHRRRLLGPLRRHPPGLPCLLVVCAASKRSSPSHRVGYCIIAL